MKYIIIALITILALTQIVTAIGICDSTPQIRTNCTMVTPSISCNKFNFTIFNLTASVTTGDLSLFQPGTAIYSFNFTEGKGDYIIELCDGTTREVFVREEANTKMFLIIGLFGVGLLYALLIHFVSSSHNEDKHSSLKILFSMVTLGVIVILSSFMLHAGTDESISPNLQKTLEINYGLSMWTTGLFAVYLVVFLLLTVLTWMTGKDYSLIIRDKFRKKQDDDD